MIKSCLKVFPLVCSISQFLLLQRLQKKQCKQRKYLDEVKKIPSPLLVAIKEDNIWRRRRRWRRKKTFLSHNIHQMHTNLLDWSINFWFRFWLWFFCFHWLTSWFFFWWWWWWCRLFKCHITKLILKCLFLSLKNISINFICNQNALSLDFKVVLQNRFHSKHWIPSLSATSDSIPSSIATVCMILGSWRYLLNIDIPKKIKMIDFKQTENFTFQSWIFWRSYITRKMVHFEWNKKIGRR